MPSVSSFSLHWGMCVRPTVVAWTDSLLLCQFFNEGNLYMQWFFFFLYFFYFSSCENAGPAAVQSMQVFQNKKTSLSLSLSLSLYSFLVSFCFSSFALDLGFASLFKMTQVGGVALGIEQLVEGKCEAALLFKVDRVFFPHVVHYVHGGKRLKQMMSVDLVVFDRSVSVFSHCNWFFFVFVNVVMVEWFVNNFFS